MPASGWSQLSASQPSRSLIAAPARVAGLQAAAIPEIDAVHRFTEDVQLQLLGGAITDPHRVGTAITLPVLEDLLGQVSGPVNAVHQVQRRFRTPPLLHPGQHPLRKRPAPHR